MTTQEFKNELIKFLKEVNSQQSAFIKEADQSAGFIAQTYRNVDLSTAASEFAPGLIIGFPFKSIIFENASSDSVRVKCKYNSNDAGVSFQTYGDNASVKTDRMFSKAFIFWDAQPGETIDITVYLTADYFSGSLKNSGTVSVAEIVDPVVIDKGNVRTITNPVIAATTATQVVVSSAGIRKIKIFNDDTETIYIGGDSTITDLGATKGEPLPAGLVWETECVDDVWIYSVGGNAAGLVTVSVESRV